ncbi:hypothetical protein WICMUC_005976 [Wickerhamomyces mucosus]|uniref:Origin recognition complex subunit 3 winged helix C-terminal domain-containing protein n=1 Tax=Wickerhamomyces mucosus TaxID=1378264 RepID=A0A9P8P1A1_9ASCO|nr:hypothetical protein WICMUC_005976 [Wickerhamomyces mucosus]
MDETAFLESQSTVYVLKKKSKRSKLNPETLIVSEEGYPLNSKTPFLKLLEGKESPENAEQRYKLYSRNINRQQLKSKDITQNFNTSLLKDLSKVINAQNSESEIDTIALFNKQGDHFLDQFINHLRQNPNVNKIITMNSKQCTTMRFTIKHIVDSIIKVGYSTKIETTKVKNNNNNDSNGNDNDEDNDEDDEEGQFFDKRVPYDLDIVSDWCQKNSFQNNRVILIFEDVNSFDLKILNRLLKFIHSYRNRIPFKLVFNLATSLKVFLKRLEHEIQYLLNFKEFKLDQSNQLLNILVDQLIISDNILLESNLAGTILNKFKSIKNIDDFLKILKFAKMSYFFSNPFSCDLNYLSTEYIQPLRTTKSFQQYINHLHENKEFDEIETLLTNDEKMNELYQNSKVEFSSNVENFKFFYKFITEIFIKYFTLSKLKTLNHLDIYYQLITNDEVTRILFINDLIGTFKNLSYDQLKQFFNEMKISENFLVNKFVTEDLNFVRFDQLDKWSISESKEYVLQHKIEFKKLKEFMSKKFETFIKTSFHQFDNLLFHEFFLICDPDNTIKQNLFPSFRNVLEQSLLNHENYLNTSIQTSFDKFEQLNDMINPILVEVYQIFRETNLMLNIFDFYQSFRYSLNSTKIIDQFLTILDDDEYKLLENYLNDNERFNFIYQFFNDTNTTKEEKFDKLILVFFLQKYFKVVTGVCSEYDIVNVDEEYLLSVESLLDNILEEIELYNVEGPERLVELKITGAGVTSGASVEYEEKLKAEVMFELEETNPKDLLEALDFELNALETVDKVECGDEVVDVEVKDS